MKPLMATTLSLGLLISGGYSTTPAFAEDVKLSPKEQAVITMKNIQKETSKMTVKQKQKYYDKVINEIVKDAKQEKSVVGQIKVIHDRLASRITYDWEILTNPDYDNFESYTKLGAIVNGKGVCQAYAEVFRDALTKAGIRNKFIADYKMNHAWNLVKIDGKFYHIDLTWDDSMEVPRYTYFLVNDSKLQEDHETYVPTRKSKATSTKYLNFSIPKSWQMVSSDKTGIAYRDSNGIYKIDLDGNKSTVHEFINRTTFQEENDSYAFFTDREEHINSDGRKTYKWTLFGIPKSNIAEKKILYTHNKNFLYTFYKDYAEITYFIDGETYSTKVGL